MLRYTLRILPFCFILHSLHVVVFIVALAEYLLIQCMVAKDSSAPQYSRIYSHDAFMYCLRHTISLHPGKYNAQDIYRLYPYKRM